MANQHHTIEKAEKNKQVFSCLFILLFTFSLLYPHAFLHLGSIREWKLIAS